MQKIYIKATLAIISLLVLFVLNIVLGSVKVPLHAIADLFFGDGEKNIVWYNIIMRSRLPQTVVALGAGMALGIAGLLMQTLFRNPLAGPSVLGISSGASLGVGFVILVAGQLFHLSFASMGLMGDVSLLIAALSGSTLPVLHLNPFILLFKIPVQGYIDFRTTLSVQ